jgi:UDP-N-acetylmuramoylalanine--D-glutamate ligase
MAMIRPTSFSGRPVAVLGLGKSGIVAAKALAAAGAEVRAWDDNPATRERAHRDGIAIVELASCDWSDIATLVISPGIAHTHPAPHPVALRARARGAEIIGDIEVLARNVRGPRWVGITGTNGKSTTTALIGHVLDAAGRRAEVGGNIGTPALSLATLGSEGIYVLEMSSYQLEITPSLAFDVAILLNVTPDHLDRHGGMEGYVAAKTRIFQGQARLRVAVIGVDDEICARLADRFARDAGRIVTPISATRRLEAGVYVVDGEMIDATAAPARRVCDLRAIATLPGAHNWQNAAAAYAACRALGVDAATIAAALASYPGLPHRQERVGAVGPVVFVNDSKATNADATAKALGCYDAIWWIAGGIAKEGGIDSLAGYWPRIRKAYLIGKAAPDFARTLASAGVAHRMSGTLEVALAEAADDAARAEDANRVVLLSPACASFDQFANFEARGARFRELVAALAARGRAA